MNAVQMIGMPESDCIVAQTAVYLARAPKNREVSWQFFSTFACSSFMCLYFYIDL